MSTQDVTLVIPTDSLKKLLDDQPDISLKLQSMACEKIAEELNRKIRNQFTQVQIDTIVRDVLARAKQALSTQWSFPKEAVRVIEELAETAVREEIDRELSKRMTIAVSRAQKELDDMLARKLEQFEKNAAKHKRELATWFEAEANRTARQSFLDVLKEAKENGL